MKANWHIDNVHELEPREIVKAFIEDRSVRLYGHGVSGGTEAVTLCRIVERVSGSKLNLKQAHVFWVKDDGGVKIIRKGLEGINLIEFYNRSAGSFQEYLEELGLV